MYLFISILLSVLTLGYCDSNYTVTNEVWFKVRVDNSNGPNQHFIGTFTVALFGEAAPITTLNVASIVKGYKKGRRKMLHYKDTIAHRVVQDFVVQMGDITHHNGDGGMSIFGKKFNDEEFILSHRGPGWVSMANTGPDSNNSQFFILLTRARWLDGKHVVFGKVIRGMDVVHRMASVTTDINAYPIDQIYIVDCGVNKISGNYELPEYARDSEEDFTYKWE